MTDAKQMFREAHAAYVRLQPANLDFESRYGQTYAPDDVRIIAELLEVLDTMASPPPAG